jgi:large subunit ribosomal protein L18
LRVTARHIYVQFIDDVAAVTLASASTRSKDFELRGKPCTVETAKALGSFAATQAKDRGIGTVVFDRGGSAYRGRVKALADAAREAGLQF